MSKLNLRDEDPPLPNRFELTELNPDLLRDPHSMLDRLREEAPRAPACHPPKSAV